MDAVQQAELADAREGTLFFLGSLHVQREPSFDLGMISNFVTGTSVLGDLKNGTEMMLKSCETGRKVLDGVDAIKTKLKEMFAQYFDAIVDRIASIYGEASAVTDWVGEFSTWAISTFAGSLGDIIPGWGYVQDAADMYDGVKKAVVNAVAWLGQVYSGWGVKLLEGGPSIIANAIAAHNVAGLAGGLKDIAITSCKIGLKAGGDATAGVGSIVGAVTGILQRVANMINYAIQRFLLNRTIDQASYQWKNNGEIRTDQAKFLPWFRNACVCTPVVASLVMCSNLVANPIRFLALINEQNDVITQAEYEAGVKHIEKLKGLSKDYLREYSSGYQLKFTSDEPFLDNTLKHVLEG